jgi:hypothetical protein
MKANWAHTTYCIAYVWGGGYCFYDNYYYWYNNSTPPAVAVLLPSRVQFRPEDWERVGSTIDRCEDGDAVSTVR